MSFEQNETSRNSEEVLKKSFLRANFCSELYPHIEGMPITQADAYLLGMFSTLDVLVDAPIEEVMAEIPVADEVRAAIVSQEGICGTLYQLVLSYEKADWKSIVVYANELGMETDILAQIYFDCVEKGQRDLGELREFRSANEDRGGNSSPESLERQIISYNKKDCRTRKTCAAVFFCCVESVYITLVLWTILYPAEEIASRISLTCWWFLVSI